jgi:hypothetical protein
VISPERLAENERLQARITELEEAAQDVEKWLVDEGMDVGLFDGHPLSALRALLGEK